jgi:HJR/Mrr/RecB family endonuclease
MPRLRLSPRTRPRKERDPLFDPKPPKGRRPRRDPLFDPKPSKGREPRRDPLFDLPPTRSNRRSGRRSSIDGAPIDPVTILAGIILPGILATLAWLCVSLWNVYAWLSAPIRTSVRWDLFFPFPVWIHVGIILSLFLFVILVRVEKRREQERLERGQENLLAIQSLNERREQEKLQREQEKLSAIQSLNEMQALSPTEFELMVLKLFELWGLQVEHHGGKGDRGVDLVVTDNKGYRRIVQCKKWRGRISRAVIDELNSVVGHEGALGGILVTTGHVTDDVRHWAKELDIQIIDGETLVKFKTEAEAPLKSSQGVSV